MVVRNSSGTFCVAGAIKFNQVVSPLEVEVLAIKEALQWRCNSSFGLGEIITGSKIATDLVSSSSTYLGPLYFLVKDIRALLDCYSNFKCSFSHRESIHKAAYEFAKFSRTVKAPTT